MNFKYSLYFLFHLIYIPIAINYFWLFGEDVNTSLHGILLVSVITVVSFLYHSVITLLCYAVIENPKYYIVAFLFPTIIAVFFKGVLNKGYKLFDFGNEYTLWILIFFSLIINLIVYAAVNKEIIRKAP